MKLGTLIGLTAFICFTCADNAFAQMQQPQQFYCDGKQVGGWTRQSKMMRTTFWFAQYAPGDLAYRQVLIILYDNQPNHAYYQDAVTKSVKGRYYLDTGRYSLLPLELRKQRIEDIPESAFPAPGELPTIEELLKRPGDGPGSQVRLLPIPPTVEYPRLKRSVWDTKYTSQFGLNRIRARLELDGVSGNYKPEGGGVGTLSQIRYDPINEQGFVIRGVFVLGEKTGQFVLNIPKSNINSFTGTWNGADGTSGVWDGTRVE